MSHTPTAKVFILRFCAEPFSLLTNNHHSCFSFLSYLSRSLADCWGTTVDFTTCFLHSSRFSAFRSMIFHSRPVHSLILSSHCFLCLLMGRQHQRVDSVSLSSNDSVVGLRGPSLCALSCLSEVTARLPSKENRCWSG